MRLSGHSFSGRSGNRPSLGRPALAPLYAHSRPFNIYSVRPGLRCPLRTDPIPKVHECASVLIHIDHTPDVVRGQEGELEDESSSEGV